MQFVRITVQGDQDGTRMLPGCSLALSWDHSSRDNSAVNWVTRMARITRDILNPADEQSDLSLSPALTISPPYPGHPGREGDIQRDQKIKDKKYR